MKKSTVILFITIGFILAFGIYFILDNMKVQETSKIMDQIKNSFEAKQYSKAADLLNPLVQKEYHPALEQMAILYAIGKGVEKNDEAALELIKKSSNMWLGKHYKNSTCNTPDAVFATVIYTTAREIETIGYKKDAERWYSIAKSNGYDPKRCPLN